MTTSDQDLFLEAISIPKRVLFEGELAATLSEWGISRPLMTRLQYILEIFENTFDKISSKEQDTLRYEIINFVSRAGFIRTGEPNSFITENPKRMGAAINTAQGIIILFTTKYIDLLHKGGIEKLDSAAKDLEALKKSYEKALDGKIRKFNDNTNKKIISIDTNIAEKTKQFKEETNQFEKIVFQKAADKVSEANKTVLNISVEDAQDQFKEAKISNGWQIAIWSVISVVAISGIVAILFWFYNEAESAGDLFIWSPKTVIQLVVRLGFISLFTTILLFGLRILRSQLHMREHNMHRRRIANSLAAFVESANTPDQRDKILINLVNAVAEFGSSGLIRTDSKSDRHIISIDHITKGFDSIKGE